MLFGLQQHAISVFFSFRLLGSSCLQRHFLTSSFCPVTLGLVINKHNNVLFLSEGSEGAERLEKSFDRSKDIVSQLLFESSYMFIYAITEERIAFFQGLLKSSLVPVLPSMDRASLSSPPPFFSSSFSRSFPVFLSSTPPYPLLSLTPLITKHRGSDEQVALRAAVYKTRCASTCVCV